MQYAKLHIFGVFRNMADKIYDENLNLIKEDGGGCNWNDLYNLALMGEKCYAFGTSRK